MKLHVRKDLGVVREGDIVDVETDEHGAPLEQFWRRRLRDALIDGCVDVVKDKPEPARQRRKSEDTSEERQ